MARFISPEYTVQVASVGCDGEFGGLNGFQRLLNLLGITQQAALVRVATRRKTCRPGRRPARYRNPNVVDISSANVFVDAGRTPALNTRVNCATQPAGD